MPTHHANCISEVQLSTGGSAFHRGREAQDPAARHTMSREEHSAEPLSHWISQVEDIVSLVLSAIDLCTCCPAILNPSTSRLEVKRRDGGYWLERGGMAGSESTPPPRKQCYAALLLLPRRCGPPCAKPIALARPLHHIVMCSRVLRAERISSQYSAQSHRTPPSCGNNSGTLASAPATIHQATVHASASGA